ncbi:MAG: hypothetical protein QM760_07510 [Nibricoccus sp.]
MLALTSTAQTSTSTWHVPQEFIGEWAIESSTTNKKSGGHVFADMIGKSVIISEDQISWIETWGENAQGKTNWVRVSRTIVPKAEISPFAYDLIAGDRYKAWSRVAIMRVDGDELHLCVNFPQGPRPTDFKKGNDGREFVILRKIKRP